jgi:signal transduction histidine kinase
MSREAEKLALGNYDVTFNGGGYREMEGLADALNHAAHELSGLDRMQKELIANVSHDLRTPLTLISGYSEVMRDIPGEMTAENMQIIIDETARLNSLVSDLLDVSRFMQDSGKLALSTFSLTETVREAMGRYSRLIERDGYVVDFESDGDVFVRADKGRILQVIYNLVNNAINYTGDDKRVVIRQTVKDGRCMIEVTDSGSGIPEEELPMIWERYYKSNAFHKRVALGTGLGLSIVKNILVSHKARFGVRSRTGEGSTFWFELPTHEEE